MISSGSFVCRVRRAPRTERFIEAERALQTGLVSAVVPDDELPNTARELAQEMLETTPLGLRLTKECLNASIDAGSLESVIAMEDRNQILCTQTEDFHLICSS